jgi:superfamily II DNA helicase RecQ
VVGHDSMLRAIAEARPQSLAALRRVPGMGPLKLERYGAEILALVARPE